MNRWHAVEGAPNPLGATWIESERAYNFAIYSKHATGMVLLLSRNPQPHPCLWAGVEPTLDSSRRFLI
jgi:isoamylase